jgi:hypothetical protein
MLLVLFLGGFYYLIRKHYGNNEALIACLVLSLSPVIAVNSIRFMTEMLSMVLIFFSFFFLLLSIKNSRTLYAVLSGLLCGLLMLSKQIGIVVFGFYGLVLIWFIVRRRQDARWMLYALGTAACVFAPYFIWAIYNNVDVFGFLSLFLGNEPEWTRLTLKAFRRFDSSVVEFAVLFYTGNEILFTVSVLLPIYHFIRTRAGDFPQNFVFLLTGYLTGVMIIWHITNFRHTIVLLPFIAFMFGYCLPQTVKNKIAIWASVILLLMAASYSLYKMPEHRKIVNAPILPKAMAEGIQQDTSSTGRTLAIQAFDYLMYSRKPVIWPYPNLRHIPSDIFEKQTPAKLFDLLMHYNIDYIVIDMRYVSEHDNFIGRNYPFSFVKNCEALEKQGKLALWMLSNNRVFILLKVIR